MFAPIALMSGIHCMNKYLIHPKILDSTSKELQDGDTVIVIKNLSLERCAETNKSWNKSQEYTPQ
jgi:uncharacterized Zn ribbon protein